MINITNKAECCGCNACGDICAKKAITFKTDNEGFWYPEVNKDLCTDCGLCEKVCPVVHADELKKNDFNPPKCFAAQCKNLESLFNSTSGSAFATLAEKMYKMGGYVGGAIFNEDYSVTQFISSNKADLDKIRNSKYAQSNSEGFYIAVRDLLKAEEKVLVCGLPCQMAALRSFLRKDYENLIIVDLICLGINSPKILKAYLCNLEEKQGSKIVYYKAKNKELGWRQLTTKVVFENGEVLYDKRDTNPFTHGFISTHAFSRPSCYECRFKGNPRISDITIGDLWGAERIVGKNYDGDMGTSVLMINSQKGMDFYDSMKSNFRETEIPYEEVLKGNPALVVSLSRPDIDREVFYKDLDGMSFDDFAAKYIKVPAFQPLSLKRKVLNNAKFWYYVLKASGMSLTTWWKNIRYNFLSKNVKSNITEGRYMIIYKHCIMDISSKSAVDLNGIFVFGHKRVKGSCLESRLLLDPGATLKVGTCYIAYGADIEVFRNASLSIGSGCHLNMQSTIICGEKITLADDVCFGRNVTVRDNNGGHFMSRRTYKDKRAVTIGQHSWLCEQAMVMPGAKIGVGVIVGARSMVSGKLPNFTLASGTPAEVVDEDIFWKQ